MIDQLAAVRDPQLAAEWQRVIERLAVDGITMEMVNYEVNFARRFADPLVQRQRAPAGREA